MTKGKAWVIWGLCLVVVIVAGSLLWDLAIEQGIAYYEGRAVFESDAEYAEFKRAIVDTDAQIRKMEVLSSIPPIIADFYVVVDIGDDFGYGQRIREEAASWFTMSLFALFAVFFISGMVIANVNWERGT